MSVVFEIAALACSVLEITALACLALPVALDLAAQAWSVLPVTFEIATLACLAPPVAFEIATLACLELPVALEIAARARSKPPVALGYTGLGYTELCPTSVLHCPVHRYARDHTSIYIYIYIYRREGFIHTGVFHPCARSRGLVKDPGLLSLLFRCLGPYLLKG